MSLERSQDFITMFLSGYLQRLIDSGATIDMQELIDTLFNYKMQQDGQDLQWYNSFFDINVSPECAALVGSTQVELANALRDIDKIVQVSSFMFTSIDKSTFINCSNEIFSDFCIWSKHSHQSQSLLIRPWLADPKNHSCKTFGISHLPKMNVCHTSEDRES